MMTAVKIASDFFRIPGNGSHSYEIEARNHEGRRVNLKVDASNRSIAARRVEKAGFKVGSVNMVG